MFMSANMMISQGGKQDVIVHVSFEVGMVMQMRLLEGLHVFRGWTTYVTRWGVLRHSKL